MLCILAHEVNEELAEGTNGRKSRVEGCEGCLDALRDDIIHKFRRALPRLTGLTLVQAPFCLSPVWLLFRLIGFNPDISTSSCLDLPAFAGLARSLLVILMPRKTPFRATLILRGIEPYTFFTEFWVTLHGITGLRAI